MTLQGMGRRHPVAEQKMCQKGGKVCGCPTPPTWSMLIGHSGWVELVLL